MRHLSLPVGKIIPIIFLVILPALTIMSAPFLILSTLIIESATFFGLFYYALIRHHYVEKCLKQSLEQAIIEFETVKKIIPIVFSISIFSAYLLANFSTIEYILNGYLLMQQILQGIQRDKLILAYTDFSLSYNFLIGLIAIPVFAGLSGFLMYILITSKKEFRFYFAKTCFTTALNKRDILKQMGYFDKGLKEYNQYLKRHLKYQIKDIEKVFSKVSLMDNDEKTKTVSTISISFETEADKLKPLKCISSELMKSEDVESILVPESLKSQLKVIGTFLAAAIPIMISIITLVLTRFFK